MANEDAKEDGSAPAESAPALSAGAVMPLPYAFEDLLVLLPRDFVDVLVVACLVLPVFRLESFIGARGAGTAAGYAPGVGAPATNVPLACERWRELPSFFAPSDDEYETSASVAPAVSTIPTASASVNENELFNNAPL